MHDLIKITDVGLNGISSAGLELLLFGIPVVIYVSELNAYPKNLNYCATTLKEYASKIDEAIRDGKQATHTYSVYQWISYKSKVCSVDISDAYSESYRNNENRFANVIVNKYRNIKNKEPLPLGLKLFRRRPIKNSTELAWVIENGEDSFLDRQVESLLLEGETMSRREGIKKIEHYTSILRDFIGVSD